MIDIEGLVNKATDEEKNRFLIEDRKDRLKAYLKVAKTDGEIETLFETLSTRLQFRNAKVHPFYTF